MKILLHSFLFIIAMTANAQDEAVRAYSEARRLAKVGDYEGALAKHVWYHENALSIAPAQSGVRLSFALNDWIELGSKYPKALETLKGIRDSKMAKLVGGEASRQLFQDFHDVMAINRSLKETKATVELFKRMAGANPAVSAEVYILAVDSLLEAREFALAKKYLGDPFEKLEAARKIFELSLEFSKTSGNPERSRQVFERMFTKTVVQILTILRETGDEETAKSIQAKALKSLDNETIRNAMGHKTPPQ
jgi:tetratricopeptide (TPR) repeat protein